MKSKITIIRELRPEDEVFKSLLLYKIEGGKVHQILSVSISHELCLSEERRIRELNKNIEQAKVALDNYTHQHQSILYRLRNFFRHVTR